MPARTHASRRSGRRRGGQSGASMRAMSTTGRSGSSQQHRTSRSPRYSGDAGTFRGSAAVAVRDRQAAVAAERLRRDADAGRGLAALVLRQVDETDDAAYVVLRQAARDQLVCVEVLLDVALQDR